jgi:alpha-tubulin suppressor-like RCC1 family protein
VLFRSRSAIVDDHSDFDTFRWRIHFAKESLTNEGFIKIAAGYWHSLGLKSDGTIIAWGMNDYGQCTIPAGLAGHAIAAGRYHALAVDSDGSVVAWGKNQSHEIDVPLRDGFVATLSGKGRRACARYSLLS